MRAKTPKVVLTFGATSDAMAVEAAARDQGLPGRMIPIPSEISAGCGLAWCAPVDERDALEEGLRSAGLAYEGEFVVELY